MATELPRPNDTHGQAVPEPNEHLSQSVFANPHDYLESLKVAVKSSGREATDNPLDGTKDHEANQHDLSAYALHGSDPRARAAASIALNHYDQMLHLTDVYQAPYRLSTTTTITDGNVQRIENLLSGNVGKDTDTTASVYSNLVAGDALVGVLGAGGIFALSEIPPAAIASGIVAAGAGLEGVGDINDWIHLSRNVNKQQNLDRIILSVWPEINGGGTK